MSVMVVTSLGDLVIDLYADRCPLTCKNFLKLCKIKYYNGCLFHSVQKDFTAQTGDPTGTGTGGDSVYKYLYGEQARFFKDEIHLDLKHSKKGIIAMASGGEDLNASQFYVTLREGLDYLDGKHTVFGEVAEGLDTLERINEAYVDEKGRPYKNIRIKHTYILEDPFEDPHEIARLIPDASPEGKPIEEVDDEVRLEDDWVPMDEQLNTEELEEVIREKEAHSRAVVLESMGDIPDADIKPPENVLFVCKLNPVTEDEDLHTIFSRFGNVTSAEVIRDFKTGDSLCYAFIEFEDEQACIQAFKKMDNALIDDRRIKVDFSQSVSKLWNQFRRKGSKQAQGCFKCGSADHIAKDCPGSSATANQRNFELKEDNKQRGGEHNSRYDMVFDEGRPQPEKRRHERDDRSRRNDSSMRVSEGPIGEVNRDARASRDTRDRRDRNYDDKVGEKRGDREHGRKDYKDHQSSRADADNGKKDREDRRDDRKRSADYDGRGDKKADGGHKRRSVDRDYEARDDGRHKRRSVDRDGHEARDDRSHRRGDKEREDDSYRSRKEEQREHRRRSPDGYERDHDRRQRRDRR